MTFADWVRESSRRLHEKRTRRAVVESAEALWNGTMRRTLDPLVGRPIWGRGDWDVLVVADAARLDMTREAVSGYDGLPDEVDAVWSNASCSIDWIERNFNGCPDSASSSGYVTANPFADNDAEDASSADLSEPDVGHLRLLYETEWASVGDGIETVPPGSVTDHAVDAWRRRDELGIDRLVVHYMQPHEPFRSRPDWGIGDHVLLENLVEDDGVAGASVYPRARNGDVPVEELREAYLDNHHWVLEEVSSRLLGNVDGTVAFTADHGNGLGEYGAWHHPPGKVEPPIRRVPWFEVESHDGGGLWPDTGRERDSVDAEERLRALGYK